MSKRTRAIFFYLAVVGFLCLSYLMVVFALGYQYDFSQHRFVRMGSFRLVANGGANVYINDLLVGDMSFLGNSYSKGRLLPRSYSVRLEKEGYQPWKKNVPVVAGLFTDMPKVVLMPEVLSEIAIASPSADILANIASGSHTVQITKNKILEVQPHEIWITYVSDTDYQHYHKANDRELLLRVPYLITEAQWYKDHDHVLISGNGVLSFVEIDKRGGLNMYHLASIDGLFWYDQDENTVFATKDGVVY